MINVMCLITLKNMLEDIILETKFNPEKIFYIMEKELQSVHQISC